ncbi:MAG: hypothetical protein EOO89_12970 [Pedobacter sp.]|nr:MAG: hypothetical protein EOO89_12970 [Pedobacter sp.]
MRYIIGLLFIIFICGTASAQTLKLKPRKNDMLSGSQFAESIADTSMLLIKREELIFNEVKKGNVPSFLRSLVKINDTINVIGSRHTVSYWVLPDYLAIGSDSDFFYCPTTPMLAQRIADLVKCSLPTRKITDIIYQRAEIKLDPLPIPPTKEMITVRVFIKHNNMLMEQLSGHSKLHASGALTAGNKKDLVMSNKIYGEKTQRVVIYGWHKADGKAIQPLYNKHVSTWADYSHGVRLIQNKIIVDGHVTTLSKVLADEIFSPLISDEGPILNARYPVNNY